MSNGYAPRKRKTMADTFHQGELAPKKINTSVWLNPDLHRKLKVCAALNNTTITALIEEGIAATLVKYDNNY